MKLSLRNISKSYKETLALQNFSADLTPGIYALLGPNGAGKSTLINIIAGNIRADSGEITFCDGSNEESAEKMGNRFRQKLGFMPQYPGMYQNFSVYRFMWYMATLKNVGKNLKGREKKICIEKEIDDILSSLELSDVKYRKIGALSGGMRQRLAIAQAVMGNPDILILDEPTAGLDPKQRIAVRNYIASIALSKIVIIATHVVSDIEFIAKEIIILKKGQIQCIDTSDKLISSIDGKVWIASIPENLVGEVQSSTRVTNISLDENGFVNVRILSDLQPFDFSKTTTPTLEDYYLYVFGGEQQ